MIKCLKCNRVEAILKAGFLRGQQRYYCKDCSFHFTLGGTLKPSPTSRKSRPTTIKDIARALGVANSTVSRALHDHPDVNEDTKKAIIQMAQQMDYQPNQVAYDLVKSQSRIIGMLVPEFNHVFFPTVIIGAQEILTKAGYRMIIMQSNESYADEISNTATLLASRIDGLIVSMTKETNHYEHFKAFEKREIPMVFFNRYAEEIMAQRIVIDDYQGAVAAVEHLIGQGYRRIAHMAGPRNLTLSQERLRGYIDALSRNGLPVLNELILHTDLSDETAKIYAQHFLDMAEPPDAIFAINDPSAIQIILAARAKGIRVPAELGVVGYSNDPRSAYIEPGLTTVAQPTKEIGRLAAKKILALLANEASGPTDQFVKLDTELIVRASSLRAQAPR
ncbi:LacI family transcriptional regulator/LacI family repressor for deo operon, udp, cdd, tsx, nupC, and nupG [Dyadobacter jejuensis]|uniref:LacI family transcriptional regulator/LacI family repressor for deo operon, udp, cdd, tsx, nupC, and nupG n=1 Tax=Dyadobacter jejuensis TaxID=1082580 RepID=A0A316AJI1_9BACT|nr:substrate-binding domain-containing protein [Dyadobacter jejuensis]PWJ57923.1 LacI family transcriptional regulator/LacI family repressor for deo operon, udp, cdd, tsx, nupC, and nupG [Dyadobacter jejuensis]